MDITNDAEHLDIVDKFNKILRSERRESKNNNKEDNSI